MSLQEAFREAPAASADDDQDMSPAGIDSELEAIDRADAGQSDAPSGDDIDTMSKAMEEGWVPKERWKGSPDAWVPASEFLKRGETIRPILQKNLESARGEVKSLQAQMEQQAQQFEERMRRMEAMSRRATEMAKQQAWQEFEAQKERAVEMGDTESYRAISRRQAETVAKFDDDSDLEQYAPPKPQPKQEGLRPEAQEFISRNKEWWERDAGMRGFAEGVHQQLLRESPGMSLADNLAEVDRRVRETFPAKFGLTRNRPHTPAVEGGNRGNGSVSNGRGKAWGDLPPEAKKAADQYIREDGLFLPKGADANNLTERDIKAAREAYAADYWAQEV